MTICNIPSNAAFLIKNFTLLTRSQHSFSQLKIDFVLGHTVNVYNKAKKIQAHE